MLKRILSAAVLAPLFLGLIFLGGYYTAFLVLVISGIALYEFMRIGEKIGIRPWYRTNFLALGVWLSALVIGREQWLLPLVVLWFITSFGKMAIRYPHIEIVEVSYNFLAIIYSSVLLSHFYLIRELPDGFFWVLLTIFMVWSTDTGAYFVGRALGRHKLAPQVSPKKTIEGAIGGLIFSLVIVLVFSQWNQSLGLTWYLFLGLVVGVSAQIGDLFESALKRSAGVKDSGHLIPGHGGILDRFDSFIFVLPIVYNILVLSILG